MSGYAPNSRTAHEEHSRRLAARRERRRQKSRILNGASPKRKVKQITKIHSKTHNRTPLGNITNVFNIGQGRITVKTHSGSGLFGKGIASYPTSTSQTIIASTSGVPDLAFSEFRFLNKTRQKTFSTSPKHAYPPNVSSYFGNTSPVINTDANNVNTSSPINQNTNNLDKQETAELQLENDSHILHDFADQLIDNSKYNTQYKHLQVVNDLDEQRPIQTQPENISYIFEDFIDCEQPLDDNQYISQYRHSQNFNNMDECQTTHHQEEDNMSAFQDFIDYGEQLMNSNYLSHNTQRIPQTFYDSKVQRLPQESDLHDFDDLADSFVQPVEGNQNCTGIPLYYEQSYQPISFDSSGLDLENIFEPQNFNFSNFWWPSKP